MQTARATENSRLSLCNPALLLHYKEDSQAKGRIVSSLLIIFIDFRNA